MKNYLHILLIITFLYPTTVVIGQEAELNNFWKELTTQSADLSNMRLQPGQPRYILLELPLHYKKQELANQGVTIMRQIDERHVIVLATSSLKPLQKQHGVSGWEVNDLWKLSGEGASMPGHKSTLFTIKSSNPSQTLQALRQAGLSEGLRQSANHASILYLHCSREELQAKVLSLPFIYYIGIERLNVTSEGRVIDMNLNVNGVNRIHHSYPDIDGEGMLVSIQERRYNVEDLDLLGRDVPTDLASADSENHATEMATIIAGAGNSSLLGRGVARAALITSSDFIDVLPDSDAAYQDLGILVQNHSYGTDIDYAYGALTEAFDRSANNNPTLLHIFSSGNKGDSISTRGPYAGIADFANISGSFKMSKNTMSIGSVDTVGNPLSTSSRGPTYDGRIKPELVTYAMAGTSNSAALVSGVATLMQQAYKERHAGQLPSATLLKAVLINTADDVHQPGPDFVTGFGNLNAYNALQSLLSGNYSESSVGIGSDVEVTLSIPASAQNLQVTLVWNDPAAMPNSAQALVNDLDLSILPPAGTEILPWVLNASPDQEVLSAPATRGEDHLNNIEQVTIANPQAGEYTLRVNAFDLPGGVQDFAIVWDWDTAGQFSWAFPTGSDNMPYNGETTGYFRWESQLSVSTGQLEYSLDGGSTWLLIDEAVDLSLGFYRWESPEVNTAARARIRTTAGDFETESFTISRPERPRVGFDCADSILIEWPRVAEAEAYQIALMGERYLERVLTTADTSWVVSPDRLSSPFISIEPVLAGGKPLVASPTFNYTQQGGVCFLLSFFPVLSETQDAIDLIINTSTTYAIEEVLFERQTEAGFVVVDQITNLNSREASGVDLAPAEGLNVYRSRIRLQNGQEIRSDSAEIYFIQENPYLVFPNPVSQNEELRVFLPPSNSPEPRIFSIYDRQGKLIVVRQLFGDQEFVPLFGINPGLYFFAIDGSGGRKTGRVVIY